MTDDVSRGAGGGVLIGYRSAATFATWELTSVGPGLYLLKAECASAADALLAFGPLTLWIPRGNLRWSWTMDEVSVVEGRLEAVVKQPTLGPA